MTRLVPSSRELSQTLEAHEDVTLETDSAASMFAIPGNSVVPPASGEGSPGKRPWTPGTGDKRRVDVGGCGLRI